MIEPLSGSRAEKLLNEYEAFAVDLDGVIWRGQELIPGAVEGLTAIRKTAKPFVVITNNGTYLAEAISEELSREGAKVEPSEVLTSTMVAQQWITANGLDGKPALILAPGQIIDQMQDQVDVAVPGARDDVALVLVGRYTELNYQSLAAAADAVRGGAVFLALNGDPVMPVENGRLVPGTGAIVAALQAACGREPLVIGKPMAPMMQQAQQMLGTKNVLMIGDRVEADVAGAKLMNWGSALVLSGIPPSESDLDPRPDYILTGIGALAGGDQ